MLPIILLLIYLLGLHHKVWDLEFELLENYRPYIREYIAEYPLPVEDILVVAFCVLLMFELFFIFSKLKFKHFISFIHVTTGAILIGKAIDLLLSNVKPDLFEKMLFLDKGLGVSFSSLGVLTSVTCVVLGLLYQICWSVNVNSIRNFLWFLYG